MNVEMKAMRMAHGVTRPVLNQTLSLRSAMHKRMRNPSMKSVSSRSLEACVTRFILINGLRSGPRYNVSLVGRLALQHTKIYIYTTNSGPTSRTIIPTYTLTTPHCTNLVSQAPTAPTSLTLASNPFAYWNSPEFSYCALNCIINIVLSHTA